jgi:hypothetical protein
MTIILSERFTAKRTEFGAGSDSTDLTRGTSRWQLQARGIGTFTNRITYRVSCMTLGLVNALKGW